MRAARVIVIAGLLASALCVRAAGLEVIRPVTSTFYYAVGSANITDTYLTHIKYGGWSMALGYERWQAMGFNPRRWVMQLHTSVNAWHTVNPGGNITIWHGSVNVQWGMMRRWRIRPLGAYLSWGVGPMTRLCLGLNYDTANGNNPVAAKASWTVGAEAFVAKSLRIGRTQVDARWVTTLPVTGVFFSPQYAELYYEIYLGDHRDLAHWAYWGNYVAWDNQVIADVHLGGTIVSIGYRQTLLSTHVSHLTTRMTSHALSIGVGGEWMSLRPRQEVSAQAQIISATY